MGGTEISNTEMSVYTNFANSILFLPNPYQNLDRTLPTSLNGGKPGYGTERPSLPLRKLVRLQARKARATSAIRPTPAPVRTG